MDSILSVKNYDSDSILCQNQIYVLLFFAKSISLRPIKLYDTVKKSSTFDIQIFGLRNKSYDFEFEIRKDFFEAFPTRNFFETGKGEVIAKLDKNERMIKLNLMVTCVVILECDRSLEKFEYPIQAQEDLYYNFSVDTEVENYDDNIFYISPTTESINIAQLVYELISLKIPMRKIHPKYSENNEDFFYSTDQDREPSQENQIDESDSLANKLRILQNRYNK